MYFASGGECYEKTERICYYGMDLFQAAGTPVAQKPGGAPGVRLYHWGAAGLVDPGWFCGIEVFGDRRTASPGPGEQRVYFMAVREETTHG